MRVGHRRSKYMEKEEVKKIVLETIKEYSKSGAFIDRKTTDTPTDAFSPVNRRFVTLNGAMANRPVSSVAVVGQHYFSNSTPSILMIYATKGWVDTVGSIVAQNN